VVAKLVPYRTAITHNVRKRSLDTVPLNSHLALRVNRDTLVPGRVLVLDLGTTNNVVGSSKHSVHLFQGHLLRLRYEEPNKCDQQEVNSSKHVEGKEAFILQEDGEELLHDTVDNVLTLRAHAHSLRADVH
jgi:hypothetical protein